MKTNNIVNFRDRRPETTKQVLERLFNEHIVAVRIFLRVRLGVDTDIEDIAQDVFVRLARMKNLQQRLPEGEKNNRAFIIAIANNLVLDLEKSRKVRYRHLQKETAMPQQQEQKFVELATPENINEHREQLERLRDVIMNLKPRWHKAFVMHRFMGKSYREISAEMGVSVKQVEKYMRNALIRIRREEAELREGR